MRDEQPNEISVQIWPLKLAAKGIVAIVTVAIPLAALLFAVAWQIVRQ